MVSSHVPARSGESMFTSGQSPTSTGLPESPLFAGRAVTGGVFVRPPSPSRSRHPALSRLPPSARATQGQRAGDGAAPQLLPRIPRDSGPGAGRLRRCHLGLAIFAPVFISWKLQLRAARCQRRQTGLPRAHLLLCSPPARWQLVATRPAKPSSPPHMSRVVN